MFGRRRSLSLLDRARWIRDAAASLPGPVGETFVTVLMLPQHERAVLIGHLHEDPRSQSLAELLIDLEEDRQLGLDLVQALKGSSGGNRAKEAGK